MTRFAIGAATDTGRVRQGQEDFLLADEELALFAVADGMGGHRGGEIASHLAVQTLDELAKERRATEPFTSEWFAAAVQQANDALVQRSSEDESLKGMGTTLCALALVQGDGYEALGVVNVGDSRLYILKEGELEQITEDHSLVATLERQGRLTRAEAAVHPQRNIVTRALGIDSKVMVDSWEITPVSGDRYLLCSDGLFNEIDDNRIAATMRKLANPTDAAKELVRLANEAGGRDNITCVVVDVLADSGDPVTSDGQRILSSVHGPDRVFAEIRESGEHAVLVMDDDKKADPVIAKVHRRNVVTWRVMVFGLVFVLIIAAAIGTIVYTGTNTYYVGFDGQNVAIYQGRPGGVLWIDPQLQERTGITRDQVPEGLLDELDSGKQQPDLSSAREYVSNIESQDRGNRTDHAHEPERTPVVVGIVDGDDVGDLDVFAPGLISMGNRRNTELGLIILVVIVTAGAYILAGLGATSTLPVDIIPFLAIVLGLMLTAHLAMRRLAPDADPILLPLAALLNGLGYVVIAGLNERLAGLQALWTAVGVTAFILTLFFIRRVRDLQRYKYTFLFVGLILLVLPFIPSIGVEQFGARIWVKIGPVNFQPGEATKLVLAVFFAAYLVDRRELLRTSTRRIGPFNVPDPKYLGPIFIVWGISLVVMIAQKDLGTSLLFFALFVVMLWVATERPSWLAVGAVLFVAGAWFAVANFAHVQERVDIWLDPWRDIDGNGYQIAQAAFAMASGGITGTGLGLNNVGIPLVESDFIFASVAEQLGLLGATVILTTFLMMIGSGLRIATRTVQPFEKLLATGLTALLGIQAFIIIGGVTRLLPLTGVTLPFVSYGGSSLVANYVLLALLLRISDQNSRPPPPLGTPRREPAEVQA